MRTSSKLAARADWQKIQTFCMVVSHGGVAQAARAIGLSRTAIYKSLNLLEKQVGVALLVRGARPVTPTYAGQLIFAAGRILEDAIRQVVSQEPSDSTTLAQKLSLLAADLTVIAEKLGQQAR